MVVINPIYNDYSGYKPNIWWLSHYNPNIIMEKHINIYVFMDIYGPWFTQDVFKPRGVGCLKPRRLRVQGPLVVPWRYWGLADISEKLGKSYEKLWKAIVFRLFWVWNMADISRSNWETWLHTVWTMFNCFCEWEDMFRKLREFRGGGVSLNSGIIVPSGTSSPMATRKWILISR